MPSEPEVDVLPHVVRISPDLKGFDIKKVSMPPPLIRPSCGIYLVLYSSGNSKVSSAVLIHSVSTTQILSARELATIS